MGGATQRGNFITEATKLLDQGRPGRALTQLYHYTDNRHAQRTEHYWRLIAAASLLAGGPQAMEAALGYFKELPGRRADKEFLELYVNAIRALARRRPSPWGGFWHRQRRIRYNINVATSIAYALGEDGDTLKAELTAIRPR